MLTCNAMSASRTAAFGFLTARNTVAEEQQQLETFRISPTFGQQVREREQKKVTSSGVENS